MKYLKLAIIVYTAIVSIMFAVKTGDTSAYAALALLAGAYFYTRNEGVSKFKMYAPMILSAFILIIYIPLGVPIEHFAIAITFVLTGAFIALIPEVLKGIKLGDITKQPTIEGKLEKLDYYKSDKMFKKDISYYYISRSGYLYQLGRVQEALDTILELDMDTLKGKKLYAVCFNKAEYYLNLGMFEEALSAFEVLENGDEFKDEPLHSEYIAYLYAKYYFFKDDIKTGKKYLKKAHGIKTITYMLLDAKYDIVNGKKLEAVKKLEAALKTKIEFFELAEAEKTLQELRKELFPPLEEDNFDS